jgi:hypothetical protein
VKRIGKRSGIVTTRKKKQKEKRAGQRIIQIKLKKPTTNTVRSPVRSLYISILRNDYQQMFYIN